MAVVSRGRLGLQPGSSCDMILTCCGVIDIWSTNVEYTMCASSLERNPERWTSPSTQSHLPVSACDCSRSLETSMHLYLHLPASLPPSSASGVEPAPPCGSEPFPASSSCPCTPPHPALVGIPYPRHSNLTLPSLFFSIHSSPPCPEPAGLLSALQGNKTSRAANPKLVSRTRATVFILSFSPCSPLVTRRPSLVARRSSPCRIRKKTETTSQSDDDLTPFLLPRPSHPTTPPFLLDILWCGFLFRHSPAAQILLDGTFISLPGRVMVLSPRSSSVISLVFCVCMHVCVCLCVCVRTRAGRTSMTVIGLVSVCMLCCVCVFFDLPGQLHMQHHHRLHPSPGWSTTPSCKRCATRQPPNQGTEDRTGPEQGGESRREGAMRQCSDAHTHQDRPAHTATVDEQFRPASGQPLLTKNLLHIVHSALQGVI